MRDAFAVLFFVSVGMLFDPRFLLESPGLVAATLAVILLGKPLAALAIVVSLSYPLRVALAVAVATAQIGEFSFILAAAGERSASSTTGRATRSSPRPSSPSPSTPSSTGSSAPSKGPWADSSRPRPRRRPDPNRYTRGARDQERVESKLALSGRHRRLRPGGPDARPAPPREPDRAGHHRAEPGDRARLDDRRDRGRLRRRDPPGDPGAGRIGSAVALILSSSTMPARARRSASHES